MKIFVRTILERVFNYTSLTYTKLIDYEHNPVKSYIEQLEYLTSIDDDVLLLEDDLIICNDFQNKLEKIINNNPNKILNLFFNPYNYDITREIYNDMFIWTQGVYYPKGVLNQIVSKMKELNDNKTQYDVLQGLAMQELGITFIQVKPHLIQHKDDESFIQTGINPHNRKTPFFIDDIKHLNYSNKYQMKLREKTFFKNNKKSIKHFKKIV